MIDLHRLLRRPRLLDEAWFALGGAVIGGATGLLVAALDLPPASPKVPEAPVAAHWFLAVAPGFGAGWLAGLLWSILLALAARRLSPPPRVAALLPAAAVAAAITLAGAAASRLVDSPSPVGVLAGLVLGTAVVRFRLDRSSRGAERA